MEVLKIGRIKVANQSKKFLYLYMNDQLTQESFGGFHGILDKRLNELDTPTPKLKAEISLLQSQLLDDAEIHHCSQNLYEKMG